LAQQPIRLMDRGTLRTYVTLLEKELTMARAALATLDANEGVLAGHTTPAAAYQGPRTTSGGNRSNGDTAGSTMTPTAGNRNLSGSGTTAGASGGRSYATNNGSPRATGRELSKTAPVVVNKYVTSSTSKASIAPAPTSYIGSSRTVQVEGKMAVPSSSTASGWPAPLSPSSTGYTGAFSSAGGNESDDAVTSRGATPILGMTASSTSAGTIAGPQIGLGGSETRFRMPGSGAAAAVAGVQASPTTRTRSGLATTSAASSSQQGHAISPPQATGAGGGGTMAASNTSLGISNNPSSSNNTGSPPPPGLTVMIPTPSSSMRDDTAPSAATSSLLPNTIPAASSSAT
jgi:hypothetical protein